MRDLCSSGDEGRRPGAVCAIVSCRERIVFLWRYRDACLRSVFIAGAQRESVKVGVGGLACCIEEEQESETLMGKEELMLLIDGNFAFLEL
ncbi:hypothetical protein KSC_022560 [Ktedonobacter sp. SOSP1-52]|nr:hypothetical protein KSC_022560 [Ktedonobacter sp. SOSP1-52]